MSPLSEICRRTGIRLSALLLLLAFGCYSCLGGAPALSFDSANKLYEEGKFGEAATAYENLVKSGPASAALYYNLGNAYFKSGQIGRAIVAYRQAAQITPRDPDIRANLQFARNQAQGPSLPPSRWQRWLGRLSLNEWTLLFSATGWVWLFLLAARQWWPGLKPVLRNYILCLGVATVAMAACVGAAWYESRLTRIAIVIAPEAVVRRGPLAESQDAFTAHDGAELEVMDQKDDWLEVNAGPRRFGWVRRDQVELLGQ